MTQQTVKFNGFEFMRRKGPQTHITDNYVCSPPALTITDEAGDVWALGFDSIVSRGEFAFDVRRNGFPVGERANRIERRNGKIRIFGPEGAKTWNGRSFV